MSAPPEDPAELPHGPTRAFWHLALWIIPIAVPIPYIVASLWFWNQVFSDIGDTAQFVVVTVVFLCAIAASLHYALRRMPDRMARMRWVTIGTLVCGVISVATVCVEGLLLWQVGCPQGGCWD